MDTSEPCGPEAWVSLSRSVGVREAPALGLVHRPVLWTNEAANSGVRKEGRPPVDTWDPWFPCTASGFLSSHRGPGVLLSRDENL